MRGGEREAGGSCRENELPRGPDSLRDADVECVACGERVPESEAQADSWRAVVPAEGEPRWRCLRCQGIDPGE